MTTTTWIILILEALAFPPGNVLLFGLAALFTRGGWRRVVLGAAFVLLYLQSAPATVDAFTAPLERYPPLELEHLPTADAIVVLGGGRYLRAPEYGRDSASTLSLERLQYAADLERATGLPLLISGGSVQGEPDAEASIMAELLHTTFGIKTEIVTETRSRNTAENALYSKELLDAHRWHRVFLVTHARTGFATSRGHVRKEWRSRRSGTAAIRHAARRRSDGGRRVAALCASHAAVPRGMPRIRGCSLVSPALLSAVGRATGALHMPSGRLLG